MTFLLKPKLFNQIRCSTQWSPQPLRFFMLSPSQKKPDVKTSGFFKAEIDLD